MALLVRFVFAGSIQAQPLTIAEQYTRREPATALEKGHHETSGVLDLVPRSIAVPELSVEPGRSPAVQFHGDAWAIANERTTFDLASHAVQLQPALATGVMT